MKFIIWTVVYWGIIELSRVLEYGYPYYDKYNLANSQYSDSASIISALIVWLLWIGLYINFIK